MPGLSRRAKDRLVRWSLFGVLVSLVPFVVRWMLEQTAGNGIAHSGLVSQGELLLVSTAIAATAVGDLFNVHPRLRVRCSAVAGCCLLLVAISSAYYGAVAITESNKRSVVVFSILLFILSLVGGAASIITAERARGGR